MVFEEDMGFVVHGLGAMFEGVIRLAVRLAGVADFNVFLSESLLLDGEEMRDRDRDAGQRAPG
jgi:hypothetical protein